LLITCKKEVPLKTSSNSIEKFITPKDDKDDPLVGKVYIYDIDTTFFMSFVAEPNYAINNSDYSYAYNIDLPNNEYLFKMTSGNNTSSYIFKNVTGSFTLRWK